MAKQLQKEAIDGAATLDALALGPLPVFVLTRLGRLRTSKANSTPNRDGLLFSLTVRASESNWLASCWTDHGRYQNGINGLVDDVSPEEAPAQATCAGLVSGVRLPRFGFWRRLGLGAKILSLAGLLGALSGIRGYFGYFFESPELAIFHPTTKPLDVLSEDTIDIPLRLLGRTTTTPVSVGEVVAVGLKSAGSYHRLEFDVALIPPIGVGQSAEITIRGMGPKKRAGSPKPDVHQVDFTVRGRAGLLWFRDAFSASGREVHVWPAFKPEEPRLEGKPGVQAIYRGTFFVGRAQPQGRSGYAITRDPRVEVRALSLEDQEIAPVPSINDGEASKLEWSTPSLEAFKPYKYRLVVGVRGREPLSADAWSRIKPEIFVD